MTSQNSCLQPTKPQPGVWSEFARKQPSCAGFIRLQIIFVLDLLLCEIIRIIRPFKEKLPLRLPLIWGDMNVIYCFPFEQYVGKSIIHSENDTSIIFIIIVIIINASPKS